MIIAATLGFGTLMILTARVTLPRARYDDSVRQAAFVDALRTGLKVELVERPSDGE